MATRRYVGCANGQSLPQGLSAQRYVAPPLPVLQFVKDDLRWVEFRPKVAKWLCLCECYPYRMSFLVLILMDFVQKEQVNRHRFTHPSRTSNYGLVCYSRAKSSRSGGESDNTPDVDTSSTEGPDKSEGEANTPATDSTEDDAYERLELDDDMPIVEAFFRYVEQYIYSHPSATKMLSLDGDSVRATLSPLAVQPLCAECNSIVLISARLGATNLKWRHRFA